MGMKLFEENDSDADNASKIEIDKDYAKRFEHNKRREDLHRLEELKKKGLIQQSDSESSSSSEEEDEDNNVLIRRNLEFFDALIKVKKKDPSLKEKDIDLFGVDEGENHYENGGPSIDEKGKKTKVIYLKDVVAKHLIEEGPEFVDEENSAVKSYNAEQEEIKREFLEAAKVEDEDEGEGFMRVKERSGHGVEEDEEQNEQFERKLNEYFGDGGEDLNENSRFLKEYFMNKLWLDKSRDWKVGEDELEMVSEDEAEIERQEEYEYRFQENVGDRIVGHSRVVEGSVRKEKNSRKEQRKSKEERMKIAKIEREEEVKHLKNLKKDEVKEKLNRIRETAGIKEDEFSLLNSKDLDEEFDPEEYDRMMKKAFGDEYYQEEDADPEFCSDMDGENNGDLEKPDFAKEDELLGLQKGWDARGSGDGFLVARNRSLKHKINDEEEYGNRKSEGEGEEEGEKMSKQKLALYNKAKEAMMEEYYNLDYEDTIGDLKTRFKYAKIKPNRYGLTAAEILAIDDKELNQHVSLKKIAPYNETEWKVPNSSRYRLKMKAKELFSWRNSSNLKSGKTKGIKNEADKPTSSTQGKDEHKPHIEESNREMGNNLSRKGKRRKHQAELKLSHSRLMAYGKIPSKPKKKPKQIHEIKDFLLNARRKDARSVKIKRSKDAEA